MSSSLDMQVGGSHYKGVKWQPVQYCEMNRFSCCESNIIKYVSRYDRKNWAEDVEKAHHYLKLLQDISKATNGESVPARYGDLVVSVEEYLSGYPNMHPTAKHIIEVISTWRQVDMGVPRKYALMGGLDHDLARLIAECEAKPNPNTCYWSPVPHGNHDYRSRCGATFRLADDRPGTHEKFVFCPSCKHPVEIIPGAVQ